MTANARKGVRRLLVLYWLSGAVPIGIVAAVLLLALWRAALEQPGLERALGGLAGLVVLVLLAAGLFSWVIGRRLGAELQDHAESAPERAVAAPLPAVPPSDEEPALRRALEAESRARLAAEAAARRKDELLETLAHELRNPLGAVSNAVRVIERLPAGSADYKAASDIIARQTEHLAKTVHDLLDVSRVAGGTIVLRRNLVDLAQAVTAAVATLKPLSSHTWELDMHAVLVSADPARLDQLLSGLLGEAVRRTPAGGRIGVALREEAGEAVLRLDDGGRAPLAPSDTGRALAQRLVELHGGGFEAQSPSQGAGARFTVRLPAIPEPDPASGRIARRPPAPRPMRQARVLIVEDNEDARVTLQRILQAEGHLVSTARDARAGLEAAAAGSPNVALVDIGLPGMDGYELARAIRERLGSGVRLIALTGYGSENDRRRAAQAGFDAHLTKPVDIDRLLGMIADPGGALPS